MVDIEIDVVDAVGTLMEEPDVKTNETVGNVTESLHEQLSNVEEETEIVEVAVNEIILEETLIEDVVDDSKLRKRRSGDMMDPSTDATPVNDSEDVWARYNRLVKRHKEIVDDITESCDGITLENICTDFGWDGYIGKLGPPPPMGPPLCESCGKEEEEVVETTIEPEETSTPVESTTTTVATTTTPAPITTTTEEDVEPTSPATHETVTVTEPCEEDMCDPCAEESFDMPPPPIPPMFPGANCTEKTDECATTAQPTTTEPTTTETTTESTETTTESIKPPTTDPPTTQAQTTACPEEDICCEDDMFPPAIMPPPELQCRSVCDKPDPCDVQTICKEFIIQPNDECTLQSVHGNAQYNLWINRINQCTLYIDDEQLTGCEYGTKNGTTTLNNRATVCLDICNSVSAFYTLNYRPYYTDFFI